MFPGDLPRRVSICNRVSDLRVSMASMVDIQDEESKRQLVDMLE